MKTLKYKVIKTEEQYFQYCNILEQLVKLRPETTAITDEIELVTALIEKFDDEHNSFHDIDPVELLHSLMKEREMKSKDLAHLLQVSTGFVSDVLNYKKGFSKKMIRKLSEIFKVSQEAFNRTYELEPEKKQARKTTLA